MHMVVTEKSLINFSGELMTFKVMANAFQKRPFTNFFIFYTRLACKSKSLIYNGNFENPLSLV